MKKKSLDAVELKRRLQKQAEAKLSGLTKEQQLELLRQKYGHLRKRPTGVRIG
ncbi:MAG: hypothetical protein HY347_10915 [candidate division NC10 bacterium]|nr:hypothetical protein [candidate division NC10 bacterium]